MTTNVQSSCLCERLCAGLSLWMEKLFAGEHRGLVRSNRCCRILLQLGGGFAGCFPVFSSRLLVLLVLTEVSDSCCAQHHHISWLLWVENSEEIQGQVMSSSLPLLQSIPFSAFLCLWHS